MRNSVRKILTTDFWTEFFHLMIRIPNGLFIVLSGLKFVCILDALWLSALHRKTRDSGVKMYRNSLYRRRYPTQKAGRINPRWTAAL